jgi:hypothetical protein
MEMLLFVPAKEVRRIGTEKHDWAGGAGSRLHYRLLAHLGHPIDSYIVRYILFGLASLMSFQGCGDG